MQKHFGMLFGSLLQIIFVSQPASALQPITDSEMGNVTGNAGVSMVIDDMSIYQFINEFTYTDPDGSNYNWYDSDLVGKAGPASIRLNAFNVSGLEINAIDPDRQSGIHPPHFTPSQSQDVSNLQFRPMTLDVATGIASLFWNSTTDSRACMLVGLPTMDIYLTQLSIEGIYADSVNRSGYGDHACFTKINMTGADIALLDGYVGLMNHPGCGIDIGMDDIQIYIKINELRFTDVDGMWNPVNDVYQNTTKLFNPADCAMPFSIAIRDIEIDTLRINSLFFTPSQDTSYRYVIDSGGEDKPHVIAKNVQNLTPGELKEIATKNIKNFTPSLQNGFYSCPLQIDIGTGMPAATAFDLSNNKSRTIIGICVSLPTLELFAKQMSIGGIYASNPDTSQNQIPVFNNETSYMQVRIDNSLTAIMSGKLEIYNSFDR